MKYESHIAKSTNNAANIYKVLSNLKNIERVQHLLPKDKVQEIEICEDCVRLKIDGLGQKIGIVIADKKENDVVKYAVEDSPIPVTMWMQMKPMALDDTRLKLTVDADIPFMFRMMLEKKLQTGLDQAADMLAQFPFDEWEKGAAV